MGRRGKLNYCPTCKKVSIKNILKEADDALLRYNKKIRKELKALKETK